MKAFFLSLVVLVCFACTEEEASTMDTSSPAGSMNTGDKNINAPMSDQGMDQNTIGGPDQWPAPHLYEKSITLDNNALDLLFVIDNSGSMCEEQERLAKAFKNFSSLVYDQFKGNVDYRIAVTSTDIGSSKLESVAPELRGAFLYAPADPNIPVCQDGSLPNTMDCPAEGPRNNIINSKDIAQLSLEQLKSSLGELSNECAANADCEKLFYQKAYLEKQFRCSVTIGTSGYFIEKGLESMRLALSCEGPNREAFGECCVLGDDGRYTYRADCESNVEPSFLRPKAKLSVVMVSDENDCSTPNDNPEVSSRLICHKNGDGDLNSNQIPDFYEDTYGMAAGDMFRADCGNDDIVSCKEKCDISYAQNIECEWFRSTLTPIAEYKSFLEGLKLNPTASVSFNALVGFRSYTELGNPITYDPAPDYADPACADPENPSRNQELCCPNGSCKKLDTGFSCLIPEKKISASMGSRYLELAEALNGNGNGCRSYEEPSYDESTQSYLRKSFCLPSKPKCAADPNTCGEEMKVKLVCKNPANCPSSALATELSFNRGFKLNFDYGHCPTKIDVQTNGFVPDDLELQATYQSEEDGVSYYQSQSCISICSDLSSSFDQIIQQTKNLVTEICLPQLPYCEIRSENNIRGCYPTDKRNPDNFQSFVNVTRSCSTNACAMQEAESTLNYGQDWQLRLNQDGSDCPISVIFNEIQPMGSTLTVEYRSYE